MPAHQRPPTSLDVPEQALATMPCSAIVTLYPTGVFAISYRTSMFYWWGFSEREAKNKLEDLGLSPSEVQWKEHYYDPKIPFVDPDYKARRYFPQNATEQEDKP